MNRTFLVLLILALFFSIRYFSQNKQDETMTYEQVQADLDNLKNAHRYR